ncbi:MAG: PD-(D/E)XK nuclease family protein [Myxococcota bacterium]
MGALFSHSRLSSFENCPKQFEFRYIQKIPSETESVEAFVGKRVHEILERLYLFVGRGQIPSVEKVIDRYQKLWEESYDVDRVRIVRETTPLDYYRKLGESCIRGYYLRHYPFDDGETLGIEKRVIFPLDEAGDYKIQGIIDRISRARDGSIEIHDYKTGARVPSQRVLDRDRQLALYQIGLTSQFGEDQRFRLVWHYVAKDRTRSSTRTREELRKLRDSTIVRIDEIRSTTVFTPRKSALCPWCEYKSRCPLFTTEGATEAVSATPASPPTAAAAPASAGPGATTPSSNAASPNAAQSSVTQAPAQPAGEQLDLL